MRSQNTNSVYHLVSFSLFACISSIVNDPSSSVAGPYFSDIMEEQVSDMVGSIKHVQIIDNSNTIEYDFDRSGKLLRLTQRPIAPQKSDLSFSITWSYDNRGKKQAASFVLNGTSGQTIFLYDRSGELLMEVSVGNDGTFLEARIISYDDETQRYRDAYFNDQGLENRVEYVKDGDRRSRQREFRLNGTTRHELFFSYDMHDRLTKVLRYSPDGALSGKLLREYDDQGNLIRESEYGSSNQVLSQSVCKFEYDERGNWTAENCSSWRDYPSGVVEHEDTRKRIIRYYSDTEAQ